MVNLGFFLGFVCVLGHSLVTTRCMNVHLMLALVVVTAGSHGVCGVAGEDDHLLPPTVQRVPGAGEARLFESAE